MWRVGDEVWFVGATEDNEVYPAGRATVTMDYGPGGLANFRYQIRLVIASGLGRAFSARESELVPLDNQGTSDVYQMLTRPDGSTVRVTEDENGKVVVR